MTSGTREDAAGLKEGPLGGGGGGAGGGGGLLL